MKIISFILLNLFFSLITVAQNWSSRNLTDNGTSSLFTAMRFRACGNVMFFAGGPSTTSLQAWVTNGTFAGTFPISSKQPGGLIPLDPNEFTKVGNYVYFAGTHPDSGRELWRTDLTTYATTLVKDIRPGGGSFSSSPHSLVAIGNKLVFVCNADNGTVYGDEMWVSDVTTNVTSHMKDVIPGRSNSGISNDEQITVINGIGYFAPNSSAGVGSAAWRTDGTTNGTFLLKNTGVTSADPGTFVSFNGGIYFFVKDSNSSGRYALWKCNATSTSASVVKSPVAAALPKTVAMTSTHMFFRGYDATSGSEIWKSDGTINGTVRVTEIGPGNLSGVDIKAEPVTMGSYVYFVGNDGSTGNQLWRTNGTNSNEVQRVSNTGRTQPDPNGLVVFNNTLFFRSYRDNYGMEWFTSNGSSIGSIPAVELWPGVTSVYASMVEYGSYPWGEQLVLGNSLYFVGKDPAVNQELWRIGPPLTITTQPQPRLVATGSDVTFAVAGSSVSPISYSWKKNGVQIEGATGSSFSIPGVSLTDAASYEAQLESEDGAAGSSVARLGVVNTTVPGVSVAAGGTIRLTVSAAVPSGATLNYQWKLGGVAIADGPTPSTGLRSGTRTHTVTITKAAASDTGNYTCTVTMGTLSLNTINAHVSVVSPPVVQTHPQSKLVAEGTSVTFTAAPTNISGVTYAWTWNNKAISDATSSTYTINATQGGELRCQMTNPAGSATTNAALLTVVKPSSLAVFVVNAGTLKLTHPVSAAATAVVGYTWLKGGAALPPSGVLASGASVSGANTRELTITNMQASEAGTYTCTVSVSPLTLTSSVANVIVKYRPIVTTITAPPAIISGPMTWQIAASNAPQSFSVSGLPSGLVCNTHTGLVSGIPVVAGSFVVRAAAANDVGLGASQLIPMTVAALPSTQAGAWSGSIVRHRSLNGNLGGRVSLLVSTTGTYTGKVSNGASPITISGRVLAAVGGNPTISHRLIRPGLLDLWLNLTLNAETNVLAGTLTDGADSATVIGGKQTFGPSVLATAYAGLYNTTAEIRSFYSSDTFPQGRGYAQINITASGVVSAVGRAGDGTAYTVASNLWSDARFPLFVLLYSGRGSMVGIPALSLGATSATMDDRVNATFSWFKMPASLSSERNYAGGFDIPDALWSGSRWTATARSQLPSGWTIKPNNARLIFTRGGTNTAAQVAALSQNFTLATTGAGTFDRALNLFGITHATNLATGTCKGIFKLTDPGIPRADTRSATYFGVMIPHLNNTAYGWFTLPLLPQVGTRQTLTTSPILAGRVDVIPQ